MSLKHFETRFSGVGGQGTILAGKILAYGMVSYEGYNAIETPTYTAQVRGGATKVDVVVDKEHIEYPRTEHIDFFLALHQNAFDRYFRELKDDAIVVVDPNLTKNVPEDATQKIIKIELIEIAKKELGKSLYSAVISVGLCAAITGIISDENIVKAVLDKAPAGTEEANEKAVRLGLKLGKQYKADLGL